jgi:hypothetical protein
MKSVGTELEELKRANQSCEKKLQLSGELLMKAISELAAARQEIQRLQEVIFDQPIELFTFEEKGGGINDKP